MRRFNELLDFIGANKKIEYIKIILANVICIALAIVFTILFKQVMIAFLGVGILLIANYFLFTTYTARKRELLNERDNELITLIGYFQIFISNSYNVYQAFQSLIPYSSQWMEEQLQSLILEIDNDKSAKPFINFADKFQSKVMTNVLLTIYQMIDEGESSSHMLQFEALFSSLKKNQLTDAISSKERSLGGVASFPLVGAGVVTVLLTFGIISVMGEMISVL